MTTIKREKRQDINCIIQKTVCSPYIEKIGKKTILMTKSSHVLSNYCMPGTGLSTVYTFSHLIPKNTMM